MLGNPIAQACLLRIGQLLIHFRVVFFWIVLFHYISSSVFWVRDYARASKVRFQALAETITSITVFFTYTIDIDKGYPSMAKVGGILYIQCMSGNMVILVMMDLLTLTEPCGVRALNDATFF